MKKHKKIISIVISFIIIIVILYPILSGLLGGDLIRLITLKARIDKIIHKTDHQVLLTECRSLIKEGYRGQYSFGLYGWGRIDRHPDVNKFPKEIRDLKPFYLSVYDNYVSIELLGGMSHCRLIAYSENNKEEQSGGKKLVDGLWLISDFIDFKSWGSEN